MNCLAHSMRRLSAMLMVSAVSASALAQSAPPTAEELGAEVYEGYRIGRHAALLRFERECWAMVRPGDAVAAGVCTRVVVAGGLLDQALQPRERRGAMPGFTPKEGRGRALAEMKARGFSDDAARQVLVGAAQDAQGLMAGMMQAGMR